MRYDVTVNGEYEGEHDWSELVDVLNGLNVNDVVEIKRVV